MNKAQTSALELWTDLAVQAEDPRLDCLIQYLEPTPRGLKACRQLAVETVRDFLHRTQEEFCALRNCGQRTYEDLCRRVRAFLSSRSARQAAPDSEDRQTPLLGLINNPRAERAFLELGLRTVGDFLDTPRERLLAVRGFGERTWFEVSRRIREVIGNKENTDLKLLPDALLRFPIAGLGLRLGLTQALASLGLERLEQLLCFNPDALRSEASIGREGFEQIRAGLDLLVRVGTEHTVNLAAETCDFESLISRLNSVLDAEQQDLFRRRTGLNGTTAGLPEVARHLDISETQVRILEENTRLALHERAAALISRLKDEADRELRAYDGIILGDRCAKGGLLDGAREASDPGLPLRLLRFLFARHFYLYGDVLCCLPPQEFRRLRRTLRRATRRDRLPVPLLEVMGQAHAAVPDATQGLVLHLLESRQQLRVQLDPKRGEILHHGVMSGADRLANLLEDLGAATSTEDLLFHYRDLYQRGNLGRIQDELRGDPRFLEVDAGVWNLRRLHHAGLREARTETDAVVDQLGAHGGRLDLFKLHEEAGLPRATTYLVLDCLRRDPRVRYLGRGIVCLRRPTSTVMDEIAKAFKRAMGEIVESRFLQNQNPRRRRLVECLLRENRAYVRSNPDRVDMLTNYPFTPDRLQRLRGLIDEHLEMNQGYASATELLTQVNATDLGGQWLNEGFFLDLLRRNFAYEILPGGLVAKPELCLSGWIQQKARETLREAGCPMAPTEVIAEVPELAGFADSLEELLGRDPMVQSVDGLRFSLV